MKKFLPNTMKFTALLLFSAILSGCLKDKITKTYTILRPVYQEKSVVLANVKSNTPQLLKSPGKIYIFGKYIFLNEMNKGVHVYDNSNPSQPRSVAFIDIPGNIDIAVKGNTLYADLYTELLAIDISDPLQAKLVKTIPQVFPERQYSNGFFADSSKVIVDWIKKDTTINIDTEQGPIWNRECRNCLMSADAGAMNKGTQVPGIGGSMARFAIVNDYLYAVNYHSLGVLDISNTLDPKKLGVSNVGSNIETIYPFKDKLFIGSSNGMFIYDITNPMTPSRKGSFSHANACDPVVADDDYAFVTLRTGNFCMGVSNQLDVINVKNVLSPSLVKTYSMSNPHGLAKDGDLLFICDGREGLKLYNASDVNNIKLITQFKGIDAFDVIAWNKRLLLVASNGLYQLDYSNPQELKLISTIAINR